MKLITISKIGYNTPSLVIEYDTNAKSPREYLDNLGYFITVDKCYDSPDKNPALQEIVKETGEIADSQTKHMGLIMLEIEKELNEKVLAIYPVTKYEHGNVSYRRGTAHGFDHSNNGFYIVTDKTAEAYGKHAKPIEALIDGELEEYTSWVNGEVYCWTLYNEQGEVEDSGSDYYDLEDIKANLPEEWKGEKMEDYLVIN